MWYSSEPSDHFGRPRRRSPPGGSTSRCDGNVASRPGCRVGGNPCSVSGDPPTRTVGSCTSNPSGVRGPPRHARIRHRASRIALTGWIGRTGDRPDNGRRPAAARATPRRTGGATAGSTAPGPSNPATPTWPRWRFATPRWSRRIYGGRAQTSSPSRIGACAQLLPARALLDAAVPIRSYVDREDSHIHDWVCTLA